VATVKDLGAAIAVHPNKVKAVLLGFDLWWEVMGTGKVSTRTFKKGGVPAADDDPDSVVKIPVPVLGRDMIVALDNSMPPDEFRLAP
jgi:hypothetical protein